MKLEEFTGACLVEVTAARWRACACPCQEAGHRGACAIWIWPPRSYHIALAGPPKRKRARPVCASCMEALRQAGQLTGVANYEVFEAVVEPAYAP